MKLRTYLFNLNLLLKPVLSLTKIYILTCLFIVFVYLLTENTNISMYELVADPNEVGQSPPYTGLVSTIGTLLFCATVSICFFSAYLIDIGNSKGRKWSLFLKFSAYFILILLVDDLWEIHESFSTVLFNSKVDISLINKSKQKLSEVIILGIYGLLFLAYLFRFRKLIYRTEFSILALAFGFFGLSVIVDILPENISGHFILEEGFKLLGIVSLLIYYTRICYQKTRQLPEYLPGKKNYFQETTKTFKR